MSEGADVNAAMSVRLSQQDLRKRSYFLKNWQIYTMIMPGLLFFVIFKYIPLTGSIIAFQNYNPFGGMLGSEFVGFEHFVRLFSYPEFYRVLRNTLLISLYQLIFGFPAPLILALLLNEVRKVMVKRVLQTVLYVPHFLSWVILGGMVMSLLSPDMGLINQVLAVFGMDKIFFMQMPEYFRSIVVVSGVWKEAGWGTIIYLAALTGINPELYEAAEVDGAGKLRQVFSVTIPALMPTIMVLLLLKIGHILDLGFEQIYILLNPLVRETGDILDTYIYEVGLLGGQYSYTTAIGLFKSVVGLVLILGANTISKKATGDSIF
ncbi:ABC transporter permease [Paenibacillus radicis (ex Xue et al. 2023)]|uniref:ABC transporter permease subunit n=1 Tax=Paenibacillus radicis (ex Xue et al. 2023) TaxID=2972489 RepID=A0ABT1YNS4_9BACL|nr:ABC transporter permease subunit [Paenibacillus radicis (ex Xue et al. 2023)]MCR8634837.1 ABC transporter permease subunit [Paenibacillus radicis (ex Xue et al. 2023)]